MDSRRSEQRWHNNWHPLFPQKLKAKKKPEQRKQMQPNLPMRVVSVNVGLPREVVSKGKTVSTGIFKKPVTGRIAVRRLNLDGDRQADLTVHGGPDKAIY